ncbi:hypothetical protein DFS34DRAFT_214656 [Phlyctochytrium arcticum]|nr:hypothetical protein DFS34DRAFT_214656 [Phlyctochytrium arcticum]
MKVTNRMAAKMGQQGKHVQVFIDSACHSSGISSSNTHSDTSTRKTMVDEGYGSYEDSSPLFRLIPYQKRDGLDKDEYLRKADTVPISVRRPSYGRPANKAGYFLPELLTIIFSMVSDEECGGVGSGDVLVQGIGGRMVFSQQQQQYQTQNHLQPLQQQQQSSTGSLFRDAPSPPSATNPSIVPHTPDTPLWPLSPSHRSRLVRQRTLAACAAVNRYWNSVATPILYAAPDIPTEPVLDCFMRTCLLYSSSMDEMDCCSAEEEYQHGLHGTMDGFSPRAVVDDDTLQLQTRTGNKTHSPTRFTKRINLLRLRLHEPTHTSILLTLGKSCRNTHTLKLWCERLDITTLSTLLYSMPHLHTLILQGHIGSYPPTDPPILHHSIHHISTIHIDVGFDGDAGRSKLANLVAASVGPKTTYLRLTGGDSESHLKSILGRTGSALKTLLYPWSNLSADSLLLIAQHTPQLRTLDLRGCLHAVTPTTIRTLVLNAPHLHSLDLSFTSGGEDVLLALTSAPSLRTLILSGYKQATELSLITLLSHLPNLTTLSLAWLGTAVTDRVLRALTVYCPHLQKLDLRGCPAILESGLRGLADGCSDLRVLKIEVLARWGPGDDDDDEEDDDEDEETMDEDEGETVEQPFSGLLPIPTPQSHIPHHHQTTYSTSPPLATFPPLPPSSITHNIPSSLTSSPTAPRRHHHHNRRPSPEFLHHLRMTFASTELVRLEVEEEF